MASCIVEKFKFWVDLNDEEIDLLQKFEDRREHYKAGDRITSKDSPFEHFYVVYDGWGYVCNQLDKDLRSIFDIRINADFVGVSEISFQRRLHDFYALTDITVCPFSKNHLDDLFDASPKLRDTFMLIMSREQAIAYERITSVGRRTAMEKVAHFIFEVAIRFGMVGGRPKKEFDFPLKQDHIGDILGLSSVHVSRAMKNLKDNGYIDYSRTHVEIKDEERLLNVSRFNPAFLLRPKQHLGSDNENIIIQVKSGQHH